ncbi:MAG TPA: hypothetical protein VNE58_13865 [Casimicrobiaceae bacterium]|nr:hypothetical protein [Casimicrobiaceae bacterium]
MLLAIVAIAPVVVSSNGIREHTAEVTLRGTLRTGVMAIGAETTGITLTTKDGVTWELQLTGAQKAKAEKLAGKSVAVAGIAREKPGVEIRKRRILEVRRLAPAPGD